MHIEGQAYAIEAGRIAEVLPLVRLQPAPGRGHLLSFRHRGRLTQALDLAHLLFKRPFAPRLSTRILMAGRRGGEFVGLVAEHVTETRHIAREAWDAVDWADEPAYLGPAALIGTTAVRRLELDPLLQAGFDLAVNA